MRDSLPIDHPMMVGALGHADPASVTAAQTLAAEGHDIQLGWIDTVPEYAHGTGPQPGRAFANSYYQFYDLTFNVGENVGTAYKTNRTHTLTTTDGITLTLPVWRLGRRDVPHKNVCEKTCGECGTGDYWLLPEFVRPAPSVGLADPEDPTRLRGEIAMLLALGSKPIKVVLTDHARYAFGASGRPEPVKVARLMRTIHVEGKDRLCIKWRKGGESIVEPGDVMLKEHSPLYAPESTDSTTAAFAETCRTARG